MAIKTLVNFGVLVFYTHMYIRWLLLLVLMCGLLPARAQQDMVRGTVYEKASALREAQVLVTNLMGKVMRLTDDHGRFAINAKSGDTLTFSKKEYALQYYVVDKSPEINIFLQPVVLLKEVTVKEQTKKQEVKEMMDMYKLNGGYYTLSPSIWSVLNSPITGLYELLGSAPNRARHFQQQTREELEHIEVNKRYTNALIKKTTGMTDDKEVEAFKLQFTPAYEDVKEWNDYQLISYIKRSYDYFVKNKDRPGLPKLY